MRTQLLAVVAFLAGLDVYGQSVKRLVLSPSDARLSAEFVGITSVREIADGRVLVTDGRDQTLYLTDFHANSAVVLGSKGKGPGEYSMVGFIRELSGDSSIMGDLYNLRWLLFNGAKIVSTVPPDHPAIKATGSSIHGTDRLGHVMIHSSMTPERNGVTQITRKDSMALMLVDRATGRRDTVAKLRESPRERHINMDNEGRIHSSSSELTEPNPQAEEAVLAPDGWIAVIRLEPLRIDWRSPTGQWTKGLPLPLKPEKDLTVFSSYRNLYTTPDGRVAIKRTPSKSSPANRWVVINRQGTIDGEFVLGAKEDIAGFSATSLYISRKDDNDIQTLRRHLWVR